jgi:hypothetical protein
LLWSEQASCLFSIPHSTESGILAMLRNRDSLFLSSVASTGSAPISV